jgi:hypothetical protein
MQFHTKYQPTKFNQYRSQIIPYPCTINYGPFLWRILSFTFLKTRIPHPPSSCMFVSHFIVNSSLPTSTYTHTLAKSSNTFYIHAFLQFLASSHFNRHCFRVRSAFHFIQSIFEQPSSNKNNSSTLRYSAPFLCLRNSTTFPRNRKTTCFLS